MDFKEWMNRGRVNVNLEDIAEYTRSVEGMFISEYVSSGKPWSSEDVKKLLEKKYNSEDFALVGLARIVKGDKPALALNSKQMSVVKTLWDVDDLNVSNSYVEVENEKGETEDAQLRWINAKVPKGEIVISQALAERLKIENEDRILFAFKEQDLSDINLD